jgi:hypothetical protein
MTNIHAFNTGRGYSVNGQRIAWAVLSTGNVAMLDIDRGIDYVLLFNGQGDTATNREVLNRYDSNNTARWNAAESKEARALEPALKAAALAVQS